MTTIKFISKEEYLQREALDRKHKKEIQQKTARRISAEIHAARPVLPSLTDKERELLEMERAKAPKIHVSRRVYFDMSYDCTALHSGGIAKN